MADLIGDLEDSERVVFEQVLRDQSMPLIERLTIYNRAAEEYRRMVYDQVQAPLEGEFMASPMSTALSFAEVLPEPPGMAAYRAQRAEEVSRRQAENASRRPDLETD